MHYKQENLESSRQQSTAFRLFHGYISTIMRLFRDYLPTIRRLSQAEAKFREFTRANTLENPWIFGVI